MKKLLLPILLSWAMVAQASFPVHKIMAFASIGVGMSTILPLYDRWQNEKRPLTTRARAEHLLRISIPLYFFSSACFFYKIQMP